VWVASFGETLKRERELREISLRQISEATKINIRYLEALEANRFDALPGGLFNKGFIRAYAIFVGIDAEAMVDSYLHEVSARQRGTTEAAARASPNLHRPAEIPPRRAAHSGGAAAFRSAPGAAVTLAPRPGRASEIREQGPEVPPDSAHAASAEQVRAARIFADRAAEGASRPAAVSGIEVDDRQAPAASRVLVWVLSLVAFGGVLFLVLSLVRGTKPAPERPEDTPAAETGTAPSQGEGVEPPATGGKPDAGDASAVLPEVATQSPLTVGALALPPAAKTPSPAPSRAPKRVTEKPPPPTPATTRPAEDSVTARAPARERDRARGPMEVQIEASDRTYVILVCDGRQVLNRAMDGGETETAKCDSLIRLSATDAGAVRVSVNGSPCLPLGDPGTRAFGYTIRVDDYARICRSQGGGDDGRP
jgi:transcriptional regulator with XRE-family HTH domain